MLKYLFLIIFFATSALSTVLYKMLLTQGLNAFQVFTYTSIAGLVLTVMLTFGRWKEHCEIIRKNIFLYFILGLIGFVVYEIGFALALEVLPASQTVILYYTEPIFLYFFSMLILGKLYITYQPVFAFSLAICFLGTLLVSYDDSLLKINNRAQGYFWILVVISANVFYTITNKWQNIEEYSYLLFSQFVGVLIGLFALGLYDWWVTPTITQFCILIILALSYNIFNQYFYIKVVKAINIDRLTIISYFSPVITCLLGFLLLEEKLTLESASGLSLIIAANVLAARFKALQ